MKTALLSLAFALGAGIAPCALAQVAVPKFEALVTDLTGTLTAQQQAALDDKLTQFQARKGAQVAILMLPSTAPEDLAQFSIRVADAWKLGRKGIDDGVLLIVAKEDRQLRIEVFRGLEGVLTDALANRIVDETITPLFKQGDYYAGINAGIDQIIRVVDGEPLPAPDEQWKSPANGKFPWSFLLVGYFVVGGMLNRMMGRVGGASVAGLAGGAIIWWITSRVLFGVAGFVGLFLLGLLFGGSGGSGLGGGGGGRVFRDIGRGGGFGGFGGGFGGGFSGGGGGISAGGGASGRW